MQIALLHNMGFTGGAEQSAKYLLSQAPPALHVTPTLDAGVLRGMDGAIVSGLEFTSRKTARELFDVMLCRQIPYVVWDHHVNLGGLGPSDWNQLFLHARLAMFMSPLHLYWRKVAFGSSMERCVCEVLPVGVDSTMFGLQGVARDSQLAVCMMTRMETKAHEVWNWAAENPDVRVRVYDSVSSMLPNVEVVGTVPRIQLPAIYASAAKHLDLPGRPTAGGNATYEAVLCGCEAITNPNVGAASWPWAWNEPAVLREKMIAGNLRFWELVGNALGG